MTEPQPLCGGSWLNLPRNCRSASRGRNKPNNTYDISGFRVVCLLPSEKDHHA